MSRFDNLSSGPFNAMAQGDKFANVIALMLSHPWRALPDAADWGPARSPWLWEQSPPGCGLSFQAVSMVTKGGKVGLLRPMLLAFFTGTLSPSCKWRHYQQYRLLLIALQLALAPNTV
ncbi:MAG: hypothetical protein ACI92B_001466 [Marinobacter maritimus]|jgi:hypothetical protein